MRWVTFYTIYKCSVALVCEICARGREWEDDTVKRYGSGRFWVVSEGERVTGKIKVTR